MVYNYTNEELAEEFFAVASQLNPSREEKNRLYILKGRIKRFSKGLQDYFTEKGDFSELKGFSESEQEVLELILTEGDRARDIYYERIVADASKRNLLFPAKRIYSAWRLSEDPGTENGRKVLEGD